MDLNDKAAQSPDIRLVRDAQYSAYRLVSTELVPADEISDEGEFPQYGDFVRCEIPDSEAEVLVEVPQNLARQLVDMGIGAGDEFRVEGAAKVDGEWQVTAKAGPEKS